MVEAPAGSRRRSAAGRAPSQRDGALASVRRHGRGRRERARARPRRGRLRLGRAAAGAISTAPRASGTRTSATAGARSREAVAAQLAELETFHVFGEFANRPALELAERLAGLAPQAGSKVFLTSGGGDSIETAVKLARLYHDVRGEPGAHALISRDEWRTTGRTASARASSACRARRGSARSSRRPRSCAWDSLDALEAEIDRFGAGDVAAFVYEPVIGSGGVLPRRPATSGRRGALPPARDPDDRGHRDRRLRPPRRMARRSSGSASSRT